MPDTPLGQNAAFGHPGIEPRWTQGNKDGVGTAYATSSRVWFTLWNGTVTEVYYPTVDSPQIRDLQFLVTDGHTFFHEEKRHLKSQTERLSRHALGYRIINRDPAGRYEIKKEIISDPHLPCVLQRVQLAATSEDESFVSTLRLYALCAPHLGVGGWGNNAQWLEVAGRRVLAAEKNGIWLALGSDVPYARLSVGYVGHSDGWTDLNADFQMDWEFEKAPDGNVALTGEIELAAARQHGNKEREFVLALAFGDNCHQAVSTLLQSLDVDFDEHLKRFEDQWVRTAGKSETLGDQSGDGGALYVSSVSLLLAHEDKTFPGALIASLSVPWGEAKDGGSVDGYHLVWPRDMFNSATALLATGDCETALRALIYLAVCQQEDGGFAQNFWIDGRPHWNSVQLDQVAFPIMLAWRLESAGALREYDPYHMVLRAARYIMQHGPVTEQERWEENSGFSPSTLASNIAALICAAACARRHGDEAEAVYLESYADFLETHLEEWTVVDNSQLVPGVARHYIRINPVAVHDAHADEAIGDKVLHIANRPPGAPAIFPAREIVDAGFLQLVRYGIRRADDPVIVDSLKVVDALLKVDTPLGSCWHRYNYDGYGQRDDGGPFESWGTGRAWPLLTGERAHYELAAGNDARRLIETIEKFASPTGLLPEQVWDAADRPGDHLFFGRPTGSAMPLAWAHAEYIKLLRSARDERVFDLIDEVAERYLGDRNAVCQLEIWQFNRQVKAVNKNRTLRVQSNRPFRLRWSGDEWNTTSETNSTSTKLGLYFVDLNAEAGHPDSYRFTFFWLDNAQWEGRDFLVSVI